jgi:hypothetical protein
VEAGSSDERAGVLKAGFGVVLRFLIRIERGHGMTMESPTA